MTMNELREPDLSGIPDDIFWENVIDDILNSEAVCKISDAKGGAELSIPIPKLYKNLFRDMFLEPIREEQKKAAMKARGVEGLTEHKDENGVLHVSQETVQKFERLHPHLVGLCDLYVKHGYMEIF